MELYENLKLLSASRFGICCIHRNPVFYLFLYSSPFPPGLSHAALNLAPSKQLSKTVTPLTKEVNLTKELNEKVDTLANFLYYNIVHNRQTNISSENMLNPKNITLTQYAKNSSLYKWLKIYSQTVLNISPQIISAVIGKNPAQTNFVQIAKQLEPRFEGILKAILSATGNLKGDKIIYRNKGGEFNGRFLNIIPLISGAIKAVLNTVVQDVLNKGAGLLPK